MAWFFAAAEAEFTQALTVAAAEAEGLNGSVEKFAREQASAQVAANRTAAERAFSAQLLQQMEGEVTARKGRLGAAQQRVNAARERMEAVRVRVADPVPIALPPMELREIEAVTPAALAAVR